MTRPGNYFSGPEKSWNLFWARDQVWFRKGGGLYWLLQACSPVVVADNVCSCRRSCRQYRRVSVIRTSSRRV